MGRRAGRQAGLACLLAAAWVAAGCSGGSSTARSSAAGSSSTGSSSAASSAGSSSTGSSAGSSAGSGAPSTAAAVRVAFTQRGAGHRVVVLLHGGPGVSNAGLLTAFAPLTRRRLRLVYYDQRGVGASPAPSDSDYSPAAYVADLEALRRRLGVDRLDLIGHSWGGAVAALYAAAYPQHVDRVVEIGGEPLDPAAAARGVAAFDRRLHELQTQHLVPAQIPEATGTDCAALLIALAPVYSADPRHPTGRPSGRVPCSSEASNFTADALSADVDALSTARRALAGWRGRALVVQGAEDPFGSAFTDADVAQYSGARVSRLVVPHAGHLPWLDSSTVVRQIGDFLTG